MQPEDPLKRRCFWHFNSTKWEDLRQYYSNFPWGDYCFHVRDPSLCAERITEVIITGMELYIYHTFSNTETTRPWFNSACFRAVKDKEAAHKWYRSYPSAETHALYISAHNHAKSNLLKTLSSIENVKIFPTLTLFVISGIQPIISPTILLLHLSLPYFNQMAQQLSLLFLKLNSSLRSLLRALLCMILGIFLLLLHPLTTLFLK